jgi:glycosyltransferase involved in cell wall biosynthesis
MRVLMISDVAAPRVNGVSTSIRTFRDALAELGVEVRLVAPRYDGGRGLLHDGGEVRVPGRPIPLDPEDRWMNGRHLARAVEELGAGCDLVHVQTPFRAHDAGRRLARRVGVPLVETHHTDFELYGEHYLPWLPASWLRAVGRAVLRRRLADVDAVVVPSAAVRAQVERLGVGGRVERVPTGIPMPEAHAGDGEGFRRRLGIGVDQPVLVHVGRLAHEKNIGFLLEVQARVTRRLPDAVLLIAGEGPASGWLEARARSLGLAEAVRFVGYLDRTTTLRDCYRAGDAFVFGSRTETQGLVLLEAMALAVPVVSTAVGGTRDVLAECPGAWVVDEDAERFADRCIELLTAPAAVRQGLGEAGRAWVAANWSARATAERMLALYGDLVRRGPGTAGAVPIPAPTARSTS